MPDAKFCDLALLPAAGEEFQRNSHFLMGNPPRHNLDSRMTFLVTLPLSRWDSERYGRRRFFPAAGDARSLGLGM